jgi:hypothetical protein
MSRRLLSFFLALGVITHFLFIIIFSLLFAPGPGPADEISYGITWSKPYAEALHINSQDGLKAVLEELRIRHVRLPVYWTEVEKAEGTFDWTSIREQLETIKQYNGQATLILGAKQVRWPECWVPSWMDGRSDEDRRRMQRRYVEAAYALFQDEESVVRWQVENEPSFPFGDCVGMQKEEVIGELAFVRAQEEERAGQGKTKRPVTTTDAGELATWLDFAGKVDGIGISLYRTVLTRTHEPVHYWFYRPGFYAIRARLFRPYIGPVYLSELQMEPWAPKAITADSPDEHFVIFSQKDMREHFEFARQTGFSEIHFWGAEWWYFMKTQRNRPEYWETMKELLGQP